MSIILWTEEECPLCQRLKEVLGEGTYEERSAQELVSGEAPDTEAMAQLAMQNMQLPLVQVDGTFADPAELLETADGEAA
jgi:glutaredoxin